MVTVLTAVDGRKIRCQLGRSRIRLRSTGNFNGTVTATVYGDRNSVNTVDSAEPYMLLPPLVGAVKQKMFHGFHSNALAHQACRGLGFAYTK